MDQPCIDLVDEDEIEKKEDSGTTPIVMPLVKPVDRQVIDLTDDDENGNKVQPQKVQNRDTHTSSRTREGTRCYAEVLNHYFTVLKSS